MTVVIKDPHPDVQDIQDLKDRIKTDALAKSGFKVGLEECGGTNTAVLPEPSSLFLLFLGIVGYLGIISYKKE